MAINKKKSAFEEALSFGNTIGASGTPAYSSIFQRPSFSSADYSSFKINSADLQKQQREQQRRQQESDYRKWQLQTAVWKPLAKAQEFIQNKFAIKPTNQLGKIDITNLPQFKFGERAVEQQKTLPKKILAGVTMGTLEAIANVPGNVISGAAGTLKAKADKAIEGFTPEGQAKLKAMTPVQRWAYQNIPSTKELSSQARLGEGILDAFIVKSLLKGLAKPVVKTLVKEGAPAVTKTLAAEAPSFLKTVWGGAKIGGKYGAALTFLEGLQKGEDQPTVVHQTMKALGDVPVGTAVGMVAGGTLSGTSYAVNKVLNNALRTTFAQRILLNPNQKTWVFTPEEATKMATEMGNKEAAAEMAARIEVARQTNTDIGFSLQTIKPGLVGTKLTGQTPAARFTITFIPKAEPVTAVAPEGIVPVGQAPAGIPGGGIPPVEPVIPGMPNIGPLGGAAAPAYAFRTEVGAPTTPPTVPPTQPQVAGAAAEPTFQVGITSAQPASPVTAQTLQQGNDLFAAGKIDEGLNTLRQVTESTRPQLEELLKTGGVEIVRLETGSHGLYFGTPEPTYWLQVKMPDLTQGIASIARFAKAHGQESFITAAKAPMEMAEATPGLSIDFNRPLSNQEFLQIQQIVNDAGLGLTLNQNTGEGIAYNIKDFDSLEPAGFQQSAENVVTALQNSGLNFTSDLDFYDTKVYYNKDYDNLITSGVRKQADLGEQLPSTLEGLGGLPAQTGTGGGYTGNLPTENAITAITGETTYRGTEGITPAYASQPAVYNVPVERAEKLFRELFTPEEVKFLVKEEGKIFNEKGQMATGKYADSLVEVVEKAGKVQDKTIYHEAFHAYVSKFANPAIYQGAFDETKQRYHFKEDSAVNEKLADDFADWHAGKKTFTGRILAFFQQVLDWVKSFINKRSAVNSLFQDIESRKRYVRPEDTAVSYQELSAPNANGIVQRNLTTKLLQTVVSQGGADPSRVVSSQYILNLTNNPALKQVEKDLIRDVTNRLATDGKINVSEFVNTVRKELMPLKAGETDSWENIVLPDEVRGDVMDYKARIYEAPFETEAGGVHFRSEGFPRYLAHVRAEDMGDGETRRLIELQSDLFQRGRFEKELPTTINRLKQIETDITDWDRQRGYAQEGVVNYKRFLDAINAGVLEKEGFITKDFDLLKSGTAFWDNFKDWKANPAQKKIMDKAGKKDYGYTGELAFKDYLEAKYGIEHSMWNYLPSYGSKETLVQDMGYKLQHEQEILDKYASHVKELTAEKKQLTENPPALTPEEQQKIKWLNAYKNTWFERILKEEIAKAAQDGKKKLRVPTGDTIARIEGYVDTSPVPENAVLGDDFEYGGESYQIVKDDGEYVDAIPMYSIKNEFDYDVAVQEEMENQFVDMWDAKIDDLQRKTSTYIDWELQNLINRYLPYSEMGDFKKDPIGYLTKPENKWKVQDLRDRIKEEISNEVKSRYKDADDFAEQWSKETGVPYYHTGDGRIIVLEEGTYTENFRKGALADEEVDPGSLSDDQLRVYDFYDKDIQKFLKKVRPDLKVITDEQGISWLETEITKKDLKQPIEAFRTEKGAKVKVPEKTAAGARPMETMEDFRDVMKKLGILKNYNVDAIRPPEPVKTDEELALESLNRYRGYTPVAPETIEKLPQDAMQRVQQLDDIRSSFIDESGKIDDVLRNYDFYTKRFGKLMSKDELKKLQKELQRFTKEAQDQIWEIGKQTETIEKPVPTDQELALNALEQLRQKEAAQITPPPEVANVPTQPFTGTEPPTPTEKVSDPFGKDVQKNVETTLRNKAKIDGTPIQTTGDQLSDFKTVFSQMIGEHKVAETIGTEVAEKFAGIPRDQGMKVIMAREVGGSDDPQIDEWTREIGETYDELYNLATNTPGIDMNYWENYMTHIWANKTPREVMNDYQNFKLRFRFENERTVPTYAEGLEMGLKPKYTHPAQIIAYYTTALYKTMANIKAFKALQDAGILLPASEGARIPGYVPVDAPGVKRSVGYQKMGKKTAMVMGNYYAPKDVADILNRVFSPPSPSGAGKVLEKTAGISSAIQDLRLSGGVPFTPLNAWTFGQLIREMTTAVGGLPLYPIASAQRAVDGLTSTLVSIFPKASINFFKSNSGQIKKMQARDIPMQTTYTIDNLLGKEGVKSLFGEGVGEGMKKIWKKAIFEATFRRFMPMQMIKMFNHIESAALRSGKTPAQSADIAAEAIKKYHGVITSSEQAMRSKALQDALTTFLFAPHYRQTMWRAWKNAAQATFPFKIKNGKVQFNNPFSMENRSSVSFLVGTILTIAAWNLANLVINGKTMSENPPGTEDKLLVPLDDGTVLGIPFLPSVATLPRAAYRVAGRLIEADMPGVAREGRSFLSMGMVPWLDVAYNSDYYGRDIYNDNDSKNERFQKIAGYIAKQYQHPWIEASVNQITGKYPTYQNIATAVEAPLRFYNARSLNARYFYDNLKEQRATLTPAEQKIWDSMHQNQVFDQDDGLPVYDKRSAMANALNRLAYPNIVRAETEAAIKTAQEQGTPVNPFYLLSPDQQFVVLQLKSFYPGEETYKTIRDQNREWLQPYWDANEAWKKEMVSRGIFEQTKDDPATTSKKEAVYNLYMKGVFDAQEIADTINNAATKTGVTIPKVTAEEVGKYIAEMPYPEPSPELQSKLDYYNTLPYGTGARSRYLRANPDVLQYFDIVRQRTNDSRLDLGLPAVGGTSGGGWGTYQKKASIKKTSLGKFPQLKLSGPKSSSVTLKLKPLTTGVPALKLGTRTAEKYAPQLIRLQLQQMPQTLSGLGR